MYLSRVGERHFDSLRIASSKTNGEAESVASFLALDLLHSVNINLAGERRRRDTRIARERERAIPRNEWIRQET